jgi:hypothetical protein
MAKRQDKFTLYKHALELLREMIKKEEVIKKTPFVSRYKLHGSFFTILTDFNIIKEVATEHREGSLFEWTHKKADNELDSFLPTRIMDEAHRRTTDYNKSYYSKEAKDKRVKKQWEREQKAKNLEKAIINNKTATTKPVVVEIPVSETKPEDILTINMPSIPSTESAHQQKNSTLSLSLSLTGTLTKEELMKKLELLIENHPISSFKVEVAY